MLSFNKSTNPAFGLDFEDLYQRDGLIKLNQKFEEFLTKKNPEIAAEFFKLKNNLEGFLPVQRSAILVDSARVLEDFLVTVFEIEKENNELKQQHKDLEKISYIKREFVQRIVAKKIDEPAYHKLSTQTDDGYNILRKLEISFENTDDLEKKLAEKIFPLLTDDSKNGLQNFIYYAAWALYNAEGRALHKNGGLFILPKKTDLQNLIDYNFVKENKINREGFNLTDQGFSQNRILTEANYCIFCHKQEKDSCRSGIKEKNSADFKVDALNVELAGCPLDEKISEMNLLKSEGFSLAALSLAIIDNPMVVGTGHRICNDCMKSCIYQKQEPVDIPQIETRIAKDVLALPFGFEIYSLLTRWNPLNIEQNLPKENSGKKILIAGLGPAGYTLAHYLLNDGHEIVAIDGLKIEPLNPEISGIDELGIRQKFKPIKFLDEIYEPLSSRLIQGFGGVAEYGITVRWDKNFLKVIRLLLERRNHFRMFGGIRFGSSITEKIAFEEYDFDHVALCIGAGRPNVINLKNNFAKGIRSASDFLMSLQLTGAFRENLFTNLQIRMPIVVIGGGLTAVDTACEAGAYYITQIGKFAKRIQEIGKEKFFLQLSEEEKIIAEEFLQHEAELRQIGSTELLKKLGGVKILYRKKIQDSPAYRLNHQELVKALLEGVEFIENIVPLEAELDKFGHIKSLKCAEEKSFKCSSLLVAAGTTPNISPVLEDGLDLKIAGKYFIEIDQDHNVIEGCKSAKPKHFSVITKIDKDSKKAVSFFGDLHPSFEGNVVKAMASAKRGYKQITEILSGEILRHDPQAGHDGGMPSLTTALAVATHPAKNKKSVSKKRVDGRDSGQTEDFSQKINQDFLVRIEKIERLSDHVVEVFVKAPLLAQQTQIGHIFRLQNYHALAPKIADKIMAMEGVAVTALSVDRQRGIISGIVVETGGSTSLIKNFKAGEPCIFMGPSGKPTEIPQNETVVLIGGGRGNQPLTALAEAFTSNGCKVILVAGYRKNNFVVRQERMENSCEQVIFAIEEEQPNLKLYKSKTLQIKGTVIDAIKEYFLNNSEKIDQVFAIGNDKMMHEIAKLRHQNLVPAIAEAKIAITSLNAPMQCMMKGVCSQCLQKRTNEEGEVEYFYSCGQQDQDTDKLDFEHLHARCAQNSLAEKSSK